MLGVSDGLEVAERTHPKEGSLGSVTPRDLQRGELPPSALPWLRSTPDGARVSGDDTGRVAVYVHQGPDAVRVGTCLEDLLDAAASRGAPLALSPSGLSQLLHHALVPLPETVFEDVYCLGTGDRVDLVAEQGRIQLHFSNDYPYLTARSRGDRDPDTGSLLQALTAGLTRQLAPGQPGFLMLSSGKDSSAVALALAEAGRSGFPCVTFRDAPEDDEDVHARALCQRLGLHHETVELRLDPRRIEEVLTGFWTRSPLPCGDFAQIPYALCVAQAAGDSEVVLDGSGNDAYMGYVPSRSEWLKWRFALRPGAVTRLATGVLGPDSGWNYFLRGRAAATLPGRTLRPVDTRRFYDESVDTGPRWQRIGDEWSHLGAIDFRNSPVERHVDQGEIVLKVRLAAGFRNQQVVLPFCDQELIDYCFHLPESRRFDRRSLTNKLLLREMLERHAGYDAAAIGKRFFAFAGDRFLLRHRAFVEAEIRGCALWNPRIGALVGSWLDRLERRPLLYHALLPLFQLSGWYNHSRFLGRRGP